MQYPEPIAKLIENYSKLPGIGRKTATRLAFYTLDMNEEDVNDFSTSMKSAKNELTFCSICGNITEKTINPCMICSDNSRDQSIVFVVENAQDLMAIEATGDYRGLYHVLNGVISPSQGTGPDDINMTSLFKRLQEHAEIKEVIVGTNATTEGEATAMLLARLIKPAGVKVTRLALGLSIGSDIDYADQMTLTRAVKGRTEL